MGSCFSISSAAAAAAARRPPTAKVIKPDGSFVEYSVPVKVIHALGTDHPFYFLCDADGLFYGDQVQALDTNHLIHLGNIYFLLPVKKLSYPLTAVEMAALASRVNAAFSNAVFTETNNREINGRNNGAREGVRQILPVIVEEFSEDIVADVPPPPPPG